MRSTTTTACPFLELPTELRLLIYDYALFGDENITIATEVTVERPSTGKLSLTDSGYESDNSNDSDDVEGGPVPCLPSNHVPVIRPSYDPTLLSITTPAAETRREGETDKSDSTDDASSDHPSDPPSVRVPVCTPFALLQTCRFINTELTWHLKSTRKAGQGVALYLSYPYGIMVLQAVCPQLLRLAHSVHISGLFMHQERDPLELERELQQADSPEQRALHAWLHGPRQYPAAPPPIAPRVYDAANGALRRLLRSSFSASPRFPLTRFELRVYFPGESHAELWSHDANPVSEAMTNIYGGVLDNCVFSGRRGIGVSLVVSPCAGRRFLVQKWRGLGPSREESEGFVVNDEWPRVDGGRGEMIDDSGNVHVHVRLQNSPDW